MSEILFLIILGVLSFIYNNFIVKDRGQEQNEQDLSDWLPTPEAKPSSESTTPKTQVASPPPPPSAPIHNKEEAKEPELSAYRDAYSIKDREIKKVHVSKIDFQNRNKLKKALIMNTVLAKPKAFERP